MLLYYPFWMFMGFNLHIYIIFGTNLLTRGPTRIAVFLPISVFRRKKEYQTVSKRNETFLRVIFGTNVIHRTWSGSHTTTEAATRVEGSSPYWARPPISWAPRASTNVLLPPIYTHVPRKHPRSTTKNYFHRRNLLYPRDPILEPSPTLRQRGNRPRRASTSSPRPFR